MTNDRTRYFFYRQGGNPGTPMDEAEALALIRQPYVSESYTDPAGSRPNRPDTEVHEIYPEHETPDDYPDGDGNAATLTVLPVGWYWDGPTPEPDDETPEGCRLILLRASED